jgi:multidrug efflux pump subunit AcrB
MERARLSEIPQTSKVYLIGGQSRAVRVEPDPDRLAATGVTVTALADVLRAAAARQDAGTLVRANRETRVEAGPLFAGAEDIGATVVGVRDGRPGPAPSGPPAPNTRR